MTKTTVTGRRPRPAALRKPSSPKWSKTFLAELAATSNVSAAARKARIATATAYDARRNNPEFNRKWQQALCEGYDHLEMELLHRLRSGEVKPPTGAKRGTRTFDNATAFRLLAVHRDSAARQRAINSNQDAASIVLSINAKLDLMRERRQAAGREAAGREQADREQAGREADDAAQ